MSTGRKIIVRDLIEMEDIVSSHENFEWDGWDVVVYDNKETSFFNPKARRWHGGWHHADTLTLDGDGWHVPEGVL